MISLVIPFKAVGEARGRNTSRGRWHIYMPSKKKRLELRQLMSALYHDAPLKGMVAVSIIYWYEMPTSWSEAKKCRMDGKHKATIPDLDNVMKLLFDAGTGILWEDDRFIVTDMQTKRWARVSQISLRVTREKE